VPHGHDDETPAPDDNAHLHQRIAELETKLAAKAAGEKGKA